MSLSLTEQAAARLDRWFSGSPGVAVAFSGGVDSALVAFWARRCLGRERVTAWTADSPSLKRQDLALAREFCARHDIVMCELATNEIENADYASNPVNRCYFCKSTLYQELARRLTETGSIAWVCSGANLDDQGDYRPGLKAAAEAHIRHPLLDCGIGKEMVRTLARQHGLTLWDKPASPCLSSRIPYGEPVTREKLARIEAAEALLQMRGFRICRVRHVGESAVVEVAREQLPELAGCWSELQAELVGLGFQNVALDREGFVSGKLNRVLAAAHTELKAAS